MREIVKTVSVQVDGKPADFRLTKLDACDDPGEWTVTELEHDTAICLKLTVEEVLWTLEGFFRRGRSETATSGGRRPIDRWELSVRDPGYIPAHCPNVDEFLFLPVTARMWNQHELWDRTYILDDLLDIVELIRVKHKNKFRAMETMK